MKQKLFTLLVAFFVLAGFQAKAQLIVGVQTGKAEPAAVHGNPGVFDNERGGYAGTISDTPNKLTFDGTKFVYASGAPDTKYGSPDRIQIENPEVNFVTFSHGTNSLKLTYGGATYDRFVVFRSTNPSYRVPNYYAIDQAVPGTEPEQVIAPQAWNNGNFEGFLAIQAGGMVDNGNLLIVVHNKAGVLSLMAYKDYVTSLNSNVTLATNQYYPLYVKTQQLKGRWAVPADFANCKFWQFHLPADYADPNNTTPPASSKVLTVYGAEDVEKGSKGTSYSTFTVKQVDYVQNLSDATGPLGLHETNNIISHNGGGKFQGYNDDFTPQLNDYYGTTTETTGGVIPLFVMATPENNCKVLSVSRINKLQTETQQDGGYADRLEVRDYSEYFRYILQTDGTYKYTSFMAPPSATQGSPDDIFYDAYTSLQKFAVWIDEDGRMTLYPAAAYFWKYGEYKGGELPTTPPQADNILPNAVLQYNDIFVNFTPGITPLPQADKLNGLQIGWWNGRSTDTKATAEFTTIPNKPQNITDYYKRPFEAVCWEENKDISGRFYFLQVYPPNMNGIPQSALSGYQGGHDYVLGSQVYNGSKYMSVIIKEIQRADKDYWRFPYDSVNMAAHWEIQAVAGGGYRFINMLGDTLKYDPTTSTNAMRGAYTTLNGLMPGAKDNPTGFGVKYFGRPADVGLAWNNVTNWFDLSLNQTNANTRDVWAIHQMKGQDAFYLELKNHTFTGQEISLVPVSGWYNGSVTCMDAGNGNSYYQQNVGLEIYNPSVMVSYADNDFNACPGMKITKEEIYYVPTYGAFYNGEPKNTIINTNDVDFQYQDSLTAYTFLTGFYEILEARAVKNELKLGFENVDIFDGLGTKADVARLKITQEKLEFIPLNSATGIDRKSKIQALQVATGGNDPLAWLHGETYKWYLVKLGDKYLSFNWVNRSATTNREKVGLVFTTVLENALPIRLYQPLVGDKAESNFLFQFYIPKHIYYPNATGAARMVSTQAGANAFPNIEAVSGGTNTDEVCFATLSNQTDFIYATRTYSGLTSGTRFTFVHQPYDCDCVGEFISPKWMAEERLLNLPLTNQIWLGNAPVNAWIAKGAAVTGGKSAIVTNEGVDKSTTLTHTYVSSIRTYNRQLPGTTTNEPGYELNYAKVGIPSTPGGTTYNSWIGGNINASITVGRGSSFERDLEVPLYYVQNDEGKYLTVVPKCDMQDPRATSPDVNGVKLEWRDKYEWQSNMFTVYGYDRRAFQLFAISGCEDDPIDGEFGKFIYLPLASYQFDYAKPGFIMNSASVEGIYPNWNLGKMDVNSCVLRIANDVTDCYRISYHTRVDDPVKHLVVFNATSSPIQGSITPIEFKLSRQDYFKPNCDYYLVKNVNKWGAASNKFISIDNSLDLANEYSLFAHWEIVPEPKANDEYLFVFNPELKKVYSMEVGIGKAVDQTQLTGKYYFIEDLGNSTYRTIDVSGYSTANYAPRIDTLQLSCTEHAMPFYELEKDFNLLNRLAILETPFVDRNLTYKIGDEMTPIYKGGKLYGYQAFIKNIGGDFKDAELLSVYALNKRELTDDHIIPYYAFSITDANKEEFFLNVESITVGGVVKDSIYWTSLEEKGIDKNELLDWENFEYDFKTFKFCLPYKLEEVNGEWVKEEVKYGDEPYYSVYLQTLDVNAADRPFLLVAGSATKYVTARRLNDAMLPQGVPSLNYNIYTVDYRHIDPQQVTGWIFGGPMPNGNVWVPITAAVEKLHNVVDGALTNQGFNGGGSSFIWESNATPVNYGILTGINNADNLKIEFEGDTLIGAWAVRPIWYYRVFLGTDKYLTDATTKTEAKYFYTFKGLTFPYGFFGEKIDDNAAYVAENIYADKDFVQAFGFKYVIDDQDPNQAFYIVSNANYTTPKVDKYRYLAQINDQLVFVDDTEDALVFQWGKITDGKYTGLDIVGQGGVYGIEGGVKFLNTTGKVELYTIDGRLIKSTVVTGADVTIPAPRGIAIVKNGTKVVKVVVK